MALQLKDRIWTDVDSSGTNDLIIGAVKEGYSGWDSITLGSTVYYCLVDDVYWEVGHGEYIEAGDKRQITRNVLASNTDGKINISSSKSATVFCTYPAEKSVYLDLNNNIDLPNSDAVLKYIAGIQVTAPAVITEAVIVDGVAGADGDLAGLLNVYRKDEIDEQQLKQDTQIEENKQDIIELEEEIEAIAPSFDRGEWDFNEPETLPFEPLPKTYHILNEEGAVEVMYANTHKVVFSNKDVHEDTHTWADVEVGQYLEMFDERDGEFLLAKVDAIELADSFASFEVTVQKSDGGPRGAEGVDDYAHRVRVKFFTLADDVDLSAYMPLKGGTFTGDVGFRAKLSDDDEPSVITIKNLPPKNPDGTDNIDKKFILALDLDEGDTGNNRFAITTRQAGELLSATGGIHNAVFYNKKTNEFKYSHELVTKAYVDTVTLTSDTTMGHNVVVPGSGASPYNLKSRQFATDVKEFNQMYEIYVDEIYLDNKTTVRHARDYRPTGTSEFQIWYQGVLQMAMNIAQNSWTESKYDANQRSFKGVYSKPYTALSGIYTASRAYIIRLTDMRRANY